MITKHKNRYILVEASEPIMTRSKQIDDEIISSVSKELGQIGHVEANPKIVYQFNDSVFIIRANRNYERRVLLALAFIKKLNERNIGFYTIKISGTIRSLINLCKKLYA